MQLSEFLRAIGRGHRAIGTQAEVLIEGFSRPLPMRLMDAPPGGCFEAPLVFVFHGGANREKATLPMFDGRFLARDKDRKPAVVVAFSDSSLERSDTLRSAFFAGDDQCDVRNQIARAVRDFVNYLRPTRVIFVGGSSGGHPALLHSAAQKNSVAVVCNPIVSVSSYFHKAVQLYVDSCWPGRSISDLPSLITDDVAELYEGGCSNTAIYLQNATDHHIPDQMVPFLSRVGKVDRLLLSCEYIPGVIGHAYPPERWADWVHAAIEASDLTIEAIGERHAQIAMRRQSPKAFAEKPKTDVSELIWAYESAKGVVAL